MTPQLPQVLVALIREHEIVEPPMEKALDAAFHLCIDPADPRAEKYCQAAHRFVFHEVLPHLHAEEAKLFPSARKEGFPEDLLFLLEQDHGGLRTLAARLKQAGLTEEATTLSGEAAILFSRFVEATRWHMTREESIFQTALDQEKQARLPTDPPPP